MIRLTANVSGKVRLAGYEDQVVFLAKEMGLVGLVQNRSDGRVLVIAEGEKKEELEKFASAIQIKDAIIDVESISTKYSQGSEEYSTFRKIPGPDDFGERLDDAIEILEEMLVSLNNFTTITKEGLDKQDQMLAKQDEST